MDVAHSGRLQMIVVLVYLNTRKGQLPHKKFRESFELFMEGQYSDFKQRSEEHKEAHKQTRMTQ